MRRLVRVALALAIALPACAQRGAVSHGGFAARSAPAAVRAPSFHAPQAFRAGPSFSAPPSFRSAPAFSRPQTFRGAPVARAPQPFRGGFAPSGSRYYPGTSSARNAYSPIGVHPVPRPPVRYPHSYSFNGTRRPLFFNRDRDRIFFNRSLGLLAFPVFIGPGYWPYDLSYYGGYDPWYGNDGFQDSPYNDPVYNNLSNDGIAPGALQSAGPTASGYYNQPADSAPQQAPEQAPEPPPAPVPGPEMQYVPGSADAVTLIFSDGRPPEEIHNYLATRTTLTVLDGHHHREIPIAALDLPATIKANHETGVEFQIPTGR